MKINDIHRELGVANNATEPLQNRRLESQPEEIVPAEEQVKGEEVSISPASIEVSKAAEMMERESPERAKRIEAIQKALQEGTYEVDPLKVAEKMILSSLLD